MHLDFKLAADMMLRIDQLGTGKEAAPTGMMSSPMDLRLSESVLRFLEVMSNKVEVQILGPALVAEIYFRVLIGEQGSSMRSALTMQGQFGKVARALRRIHASYNVDLTVDQLAAEAGMSVPTFHTHFKSVTNTSPIQYLKSTRLHQARLLMVRNDMTAASASLEVGYESPSQFSREFKRFFGRTPAEEARHLRGNFALPLPQESSVYVSSH
jgi:AraC-like DNA-binding protein